MMYMKNYEGSLAVLNILETMSSHEYSKVFLAPICQPVLTPVPILPPNPARAPTSAPVPPLDHTPALPKEAKVPATVPTPPSSPAQPSVPPPPAPIFPSAPETVPTHRVSQKPNKITKKGENWKTGRRR